MKKAPDLIDQFTSLVLGGDEPQRLAERTVEIILTLTHGRCAAVFRVADGQLKLFASRGLDQAALDAAHADWAARGPSLRAGETAYAPTSADDGPAAHVTVPIAGSSGLAGILYVDSAEPHFLDAADLQRLVKFNAILARALTTTPAAPAAERPKGWERYLERTSVDDMERERLLLLLERNEWNIARVARLMQVTRRTVYLRLARYGVAREHVRKGRAPAAATAK